MAVASAGPYASLHLSLQTDNHASTPPLSFLQAGCPSCRPTNSVKALKALGNHFHVISSQYKHTCSCISENRCRLAVVQDLSFHGSVACSAFFVTVRAGTAYRKSDDWLTIFFAHCSEIPIVLSNLLYHYFFH